MTWKNLQSYFQVSMRVVKGIFVNRELPFLFLVKREMAFFSLVKRDFLNRGEP